VNTSKRSTKTGTETSIKDGVLFFEDARQCHIDDDAFPEIIGDGYTKTIRVISLSSEWIRNVWLDNGIKVKEDIDVGMTLRREIRSGRGYWYAYRRVFGKLHKCFVGTDENVTQTRLLDIAKAMPSA
jgi:hypothetical protein